MTAHRIVMQSDNEDRIVKVVRKGRTITVKAERTGVARAIERAIVEALAGDEKPAMIGFAAGIDD